MTKRSPDRPAVAPWPIWLPHAVVLAWLLYLALAIWQHALHSVQPPLYDPLDYLSKAMSFWRAVGQGTFFNPLSLEPTARPPGTILMSYPLGFSADFHGFHFRSAFLPILCLVAAVYVAAGRDQVASAGWPVAAIAMLYSSLPMFYHFDWVEGGGGPVRWGLVDNFQAGIAALAFAALVRSLAARSAPLLLTAALLAALTLLIKPSGLMVMALMAVTTLRAIGLEALRARVVRAAGVSRRGYVRKGGAGMLGLFAGVTALCVSGGYLSPPNFAYAIQVLQLWRRTAQDSIAETLWRFHQSTGEAVLLWFLLVAVLFLRGIPADTTRDSARWARAKGLLLSGPLLWCLGFGYWQGVQGGGGQIRYFFPFLLMGLICAVPAALLAWPFGSRLVRSLLIGLCLAPALGIGVLLASGDSPSALAQRIAGVGVSVGEDAPEVAQAYAFLGEVRKEGRNARLYSFSNGVPAAIFENVGAYEGMVRPALRSFQAVIPLDWVRGFAVRSAEILDADYILVTKYTRERAVASLAARKVDTFAAERSVFEAWLLGLGDRAGLEVASDGRKLRLLRVVDRDALGKAIADFVASRTWRPEFVAANPPAWWNPEMVAAYVTKPAAVEIDFEGVYQIHALSMRRVGGDLGIDVWWEELRHEDANNQRYLFLQLVDAAGRILHNQQVPLAPYRPPHEDRRWRYGSVAFTGVNPEAVSLALGVYEAKGGLLTADKGRTDWDGRRVLVSLQR